jgi:hypothetical protein
MLPIARLFAAFVANPAIAGAPLHNSVKTAFATPVGVHGNAAQFPNRLLNVRKGGFHPRQSRIHKNVFVIRFFDRFEHTGFLWFWLVVANTIISEEFNK